MEPEKTSQEVESAATEKNSLFIVTPLSKYLAMALFIAMPFIGGWIGYIYAPEKILEVEKIVVKEVSTKLEETSASSTESYMLNLENTNISLGEYENSKREFTFGISKYTVKQGELPYQEDWTHIYNISNQELSFSFHSQENSGGYCYLGLCDTPSESEFTSDDNVVWNKIDTSSCIGGCDAIKDLYRTVRENRIYYFLVWDTADAVDSQFILRTFKWQ